MRRFYQGNWLTATGILETSRNIKSNPYFCEKKIKTKQWIKKQGTTWITPKIEDKMKRDLNLKITTTMTMMEIQIEKRPTKFFFWSILPHSECKCDLQCE